VLTEGVREEKKNREEERRTNGEREGERGGEMDTVEKKETERMRKGQI